MRTIRRELVTDRASFCVAACYPARRATTYRSQPTLPRAGITLPRHEGVARPRQGIVRQARRRRGSHASKASDQRSDRHRQELAAFALGHRRAATTNSHHHRVPSLFDAPALARGDGRMQGPKARRVSIYRSWMIGAHHAPPGTGSRHPRDRRGSAQPRLDDPDKPAASRYLARRNCQSDHRRRHPRSPRAQRAPHHPQGREHAQNRRQPCGT